MLACVLASARFTSCAQTDTTTGHAANALHANWPDRRCGASKLDVPCLGCVCPPSVEGRSRSWPGKVRACEVP